jgi:acetoin utilization protein AcuB
MAFTIIGAGIQDKVPFSTGTTLEVVEETFPTLPVKKVGSRTEQEEPPLEENKLKQKKADRAYSNTMQIVKERGPALHAHQIMTSPVVTLTPDTTITQAWRLFRERRFRHIPVITADRKVYGIISDRDLLRYAATSGNIPPYSETAPEASKLITPLVKTRVIAASRDTEIREIAKILFEQRVGAMPVLTETGLLEGIITRSDILRTLVNHAPLELWV